jgi:hypothetical protein
VAHVSATEILKDLGSAPVLADSRDVLFRSTAYYKGAAAWIDNVLHRQELSKYLTLLYPDELMFLFRSGPIRSMTERICSLLQEPSPINIELSKEWYNRLCLPVASLIETEGPRRPAKWATAGFDLARPLTEPSPGIVCAWVGDLSTSAWSEAADVESLFSEYMASDVGAEQCVLRPMPEVLAAAIEEGITRLGAIDRSIPFDICLNVRHFCLFDYARWSEMNSSDYREIGQSVSSHLVPSCCFFSEYSLSNMDRLMESIYHEALHKKLSCLFIVDRNLIADYSTEKAPKFLSYWNKDNDWNHNMWEFDRAIYAFHVYLHLAAFYKSISERNLFSLMNKNFVAERARTCLERARALSRWLGVEAEPQFSDSGKRVMRFFQSKMDKLGLTELTG